MTTHIRLQYLETERSRVWRDSSLTMWREGRANMERTAEALKAQNRWHDWRIVDYQP